ncbi:MAG: iron complex transport system substrate-binding protein [Hyphomicrobiales bacterium]|nr:iron complex transport system substrate-binding protein [Hyphomicrobiales bacterium]
MRRTLLAAMIAICTAPAFAEAPRRVVSFNLCADQLVLALADPEQIAGLSPYAADASVSVMADQARAYRRLDWQAESTIALRPDLVLIGDTDRPVTKHMLRAQGLRLHQITLIADLGVARRQIEDVAAALGHPERGTRLIADIEAARARLAVAPRPPFATALLVNRGGYTAGARSLAAVLLEEAGLKPPPGTPPGYGGYVPLERLLVLHPDVIVLNNLPNDAHDQGSYNLTHPALGALYPPERRLVLPTRYTLCGGPALIAAFDYLAAMLTRLAAQSPTMRTN